MKKLILCLSTVLISLAIPTLTAKSPGPDITLNRENRAAMDPQEAFLRLKEGNARFVSGKPLKRDLLAQAKETSAGQYPFAAVVSCLDSRTSTELIFDQGMGDVFNARLAGNVVDEDVLGSLEFACKAAGAKLIAVIGHTSCGAVKGAADQVELGHLTQLLARIQPAVASVKTEPGEARRSTNDAFVQRAAEANVRLQMKNIREKSPILKELLAKGDVLLVGGIHDLKTGKVTFLEP
ncbi:MAG: carbonic anhydrase family protein [Candidatus Methylacidiphilales bacterium]|nr:carbonic anhydrase family protein [Candidatus Methylacidiphilales bacterium]